MKKNKETKVKTRTEKDTMGYVNVPSSALFGAQTQRAIDNFPISDNKFIFDFIKAVTIIKRSAAETNYKLDLLTKFQKESILSATDKILNGECNEHFPVDIFQTGSGTSTNMNVNEVISNIANKSIKNEIDIHPNDHVNMGQSSNDVIPTAINISSMIMIEKDLIPALKSMIIFLNKKESEFKDVLKIGRTHLQDATPITLGQEFSGYKEMITKSLKRIEESKENLRRLAQGGTAVGTGINTHKNFGQMIASEISDFTKIKFIETPNHFEAQSSQDSVVEFSGSLKTLSVCLNKIANDIRWLASGPRSGLGELIIPPVQPGSSIMPGKVNPVICESMIQVCAQVIANDTAITLGGLGSVFELNLMLPLIAHNILYSIKILSNSINIFNEKLLSGIKADKKKCNDYIEKSLAMCTSLAPIIGYDKAAEIAYEAYNSGKTVKQIVLEKNILTKEKVESILNPKNMLKSK